MEKLQTKLLKASAGLHKYCKSTPVLKALNVSRLETTVQINSLDLMRTIFYSHLLNMYVRGKLVSHTDLIARVRTICFKHQGSFVKFLFDKRYADKTRIDLKKRYMVEDGLRERVYGSYS